MLAASLPAFGQSPPGPAQPVTVPGGEEPGGSPVPEPTTLLLVGTGLVGVALTARHTRKRLRPR